jgi:two-component system phosphate regulon sensor histidine kinase PhoR
MVSVPLEYVVFCAIVAAAAIIAIERWRRERARRSEAALHSAVASLGTSRLDELSDQLTPGHRAIVRVLTDASQALRDSLSRVSRENEAILSRVSDGVMVTDDRGVVRSVNQSQAERLKLSPAEIVGRSLIEVLRDHEVYEVARRCLLSGVEERALVETGPGKRFMQVSATPLGQHSGCVIVLQDRTEVRRLERVRRDFVSNISHELRTPLATLKLLSETLSLEAGDDPALLKDYLGRIEVEVDRLAQMVDELGELSHIETGQVTLDRTAVDLGALARRAAERLESQADRAGLRLTADAPDAPVIAYGDERRLEQVLVNLVHNAIKFTPPGGTIRVSCTQGDGVAVLAVEDSGIGIPAGDLERIFERFYKVDRSRSSQGTGLGLAIARHIVELHGGRIWAESVEGRGAKFSFTLPGAQPR